MPLYEYICGECRRRVSVYVRSFGGSPESGCPRCGSPELRRVFSTFAMRKTDRDVYEDILGDSQLVNRMMANDPKALADWNRRMSRGEPVGPEYEDMVGKMDAGEWPAELAGGDKAPSPAESEGD